MRSGLGSVAAAAVVVLVLGGCLGGPPDEDAPGASPSPEEPGIPPGCDQGILAVSHTAGAIPVESTLPLARACFMRTAFISEGEPTIGFADATLWMSTAYEPGEEDVYGYGAPRTMDEGASWELIRPTVAGQTAQRRGLDPYLFVDGMTGRVFFDNLAGSCSLLSWTDDQGASWENSASGCLETDHQTLFVGKPRTSTTLGYPNIVYRCATTAGILTDASAAASCQRSLDGGRSWLPPGSPPFAADPQGQGNRATPGYCGGAVGHGITDTTGRVYLPKVTCGHQPWLAWSDDEGMTWERTQVGSLGVQGNERGLFSHDGSVAVDSDGNLYYVWVAADWLPYLTMSRDKGASWSEPLMLAPPGVRDTTMVTIDVGTPGRIAWAYLGSENGPGGRTPCDNAPQCWQRTVEGQLNGDDPSNVTWRGYIGLSVTALDAEPRFFSAPTSLDPLIIGECGPTGCQQLKDFIDVVIGPDGTPWAPFVDGCPDPCTEQSGDGNVEAVIGRLWGGPTLRT